MTQDVCTLEIIFHRVSFRREEKTCILKRREESEIERQAKM